MTFLSKESFRLVVENAPLISIDLIVRNVYGKVLLGIRSNRPAKGFWFVPGGRIQKNETFDAAFLRISEAELGMAFTIASARHLGIYEHFYGDSVFGGQYSTHYIANGFELIVRDSLALPNAQHSDYCWMDEAELLANASVHSHCKRYFLSDQSVC